MSYIQYMFGLSYLNVSLKVVTYIHLYIYIYAYIYKTVDNYISI